MQTRCDSLQLLLDKQGVAAVVLTEQIEALRVKIQEREQELEAMLSGMCVRGM